VIERTRVRRKKSAGGTPTTDVDKATSTGGVAGQLMRLQASGGNRATMALLSRTAPTDLRRVPEEEGKESEGDEGDASNLQAELEEEQAEDEKEEGDLDVQEVVAEQVGPGSEEAKSGDASEVAEILALAEELEEKESEGEDADLDDVDDVNPEQLVAVEEQIVEELEGDEVEGDEAKALESALTKVRKLKVLAFARSGARNGESESKDAESEG
jgi:hypothetical protein